MTQKKLDIRLIALDLDGTLLTDEKKIAEPTADALCALSKQIKVVLASARPPRSVRHLYKQLDLDTWQVNYNGALVWDEPNQTAVFHRPMPGELCKKIVDLARDMYEEVLVSCEIMDRWFTDRDDHTYTTETGKLFSPDEIVPIDTICGNQITKLMLLADPKIINRLEPLIFQKFGRQVLVVQSDPQLLQIMDPKCGKSVGLNVCCERYGVKPENIMAFGDAPNDVGMLQMSGIAIAMSNADKVVKDVSHWVAPSNNDHGVLAALKKYGLI
jgi:Cof subfamily protein (haloacid dehalogenase superfamily)